MRTLRAWVGSSLLVSLLVAGSVGFTSASPVVAECPSHDPWPRMREAAPSAKRVVIGTVREATTEQLWEGGPRASTDIRLEVTEHVKGGGADLIDLGAVTTKGNCITSRLWVKEGDRIAVAFGGRADGIAGPVSSVAFVGREPRRSNGRSMERVSVKQVRQLAALPAGPLLFFVADDGGGRVLWRTDGTKRGTAIVARPRRGGPTEPRDLVAAGGLLYFSAADPEHGREIWVSDGSEVGTRLLKDIRPGPEGSDPAGLITGFGVEFAADDGIHGRELWRSEPLSGRTRLVLDMNQVPDPRASSDPAEGVSDGWQPFFSVDDGVHGREPWYVENTGVDDVMPGPIGSEPRDFTPVEWTTWFVADAPDAARTLHACEDGCSVPSRIAVDGDPVTGVTELAAAGQAAYFVATDADERPFLGRATQTWDGTRWDDPIRTRDAATRVMTAPPPSADPPLHGSFGHLTEWRGELALVVDEVATGTELWVSDGTAAGTAIVLDVPAGDLDPRELAPVGNWLWLSADADDGRGREPWISDGTAQGTRAVADIASGGGSDPVDFMGFRRMVVFSADDGIHGRELRTADRAGARAKVLLDINPGPIGSSPSDLTVLDG